MATKRNPVRKNSIEVKILENVGHLPLAYITASVHGLEDVAERLAAELGDNVPTWPRGENSLPSDAPSPGYLQWMHKLSTE